MFFLPDSFRTMISRFISDSLGTTVDLDERKDYLYCPAVRGPTPSTLELHMHISKL